jgi:hypothetical protein
MNLEAFKEAFQFAKKHKSQPNGFRNIFRAETKNYVIEYWSEYERGSISHKKHGFVCSDMTLVDMVNFLYLMGEN